MSKDVEQKVVEMRFDNAQFERNVSTTMSTLDKLKAKLSFKGASSGLENVGKAAKNVDMGALSNSIETVNSRFSALEVIGVTALANITNSAVNAGKRMISALTLDPVISGFQEYETQINAIQTILANTQSKGSTLEDVNRALDELNKYADQTIYNFTEMTRNIGTFTAAGVDLDKSVTSIKGIANLAAVSGSNAQQASTAMYQLSQAIAAGKVQLMDWNSVVNAGMGGELFQNALKRTAKQMGTDVDALIAKYGSFRETLTKTGWLTTEVLTETLTQLSGAYTEADLIAQGYTQSQAKEIVELANTAVGAATDVKTFTQLVDTLRESLQSGWTQTWELIIGDFEEAKSLWTEVSDTLGGFIQASADARNNLLEGALGDSTSKWENLTEQINDCGITTEQFEKRLREVAIAGGMTGEEFDEIISKNGSLAKAFEKGALPIRLIVDTIKSFASGLDAATTPVKVATDQLEYFNKVVGQVVRGDFGNGEERIKALTAAGYDNVAVQKLVNKIWERNGKTWDNVTLTSEELTEVIGALSAEELQNIGYTEEQAKKLKELAIQAEETGTPINDLIESMNKPSGRELLIDSFRNALQGLIKVFGAVGEAWRDAFPPMTSDQLYGIIEGIHNFSAILNPTEETINNLTRTLKGLFAILDIITTIAGGAFKAAFKVLTTVLGMADLDILEFTAILGDAAVNLRNFLLDNELVNKGLELVATGILSAAKAIKEWIDAFLNLPIVQSAIDNLKNGLTDLSQIGQWAIEGLQNGFRDGLQSIPKILMQIGTAILDAIKGVLGIHSPSTEMYNVGKFSIEGLVNGLKDGVSAVIGVFQDLASRCMEIIRNIPWGSVVAAGVSVGLVYTAKQIADAVSAVAAPFEGLGDLLSGAGEVLEQSAKGIGKTIKSFSKVLNAKAFSIRADAIKTLAVSIGILAASLFLVSKIESGKLLSSVAAIAALAAVMGVLAAALGTFGPDKVVSFGGFALAVVGISASILIMAAALKKLNSLDPEKSAQTITGFVAIVGSLAAILAVYGRLVSGEASKNINKVGSMMIKLSVSMLLMIGVIKLISGLETGELVKGAAAITAFIGIISLLSVVSQLTGANAAKLGTMMIKLAVSMGLMVGVIKLISGLDMGELVKGGAAITAFVGIIGVLSAITKVFGVSDATKLGSTLIAMSASMLLMAAVVKIMAGISIGDIVKGEAAILGFTGIIALLSASVKLAGKDSPKIAATLLAMSVAIGILAGIAVVLSLIDIGGLTKGLVAVGVLSAFMAGLIAVTKFAQDVKGNLIVMSVAIGVLAASVAALSFIDPKKLAGATAAMSVLMGMFALIIKSSHNVTASMGTLIVMASAIAVLGTVVYALSTLPIESTIATAVSLSALLLAMSAAMKILGTIKTISPSAIGALAALGLIAAGLAVVLNLIEPLDAESMLGTVISISALLLALSGVTAVLAAVGKLGAGAALQGALALDGVILVVGGLMAAIGALTVYFPAMEQFMDKGIDMLEKIGYGLGAFVGNIIGGLSSGITAGLPDMATDLSNFMENLQPFLNGISGVNTEAVSAVASLGQMILTLTGANILDGIMTWATGKSSLERFGEQLVPFGESIAEFSDTIKGRIDSESVTAASNAGLTLSQMASNIPKQGGVLQDFLGTQDLESFGTQLVAFGNAIASFSETVKGKVDADSVTAAANAGMSLAELATNIPKQGGVLQDFLGSQDLSTFGAQLKTFGEAIATFSETVAGKVDADAVTSAANAGLALGELATNIPKQGGVLQDFLGEQDLQVFGNQLRAFGEAIVDFSRTVSGNINADAVTAAANAGMALFELAENLPRQDGILQNIFGSQDMGVFGAQLKTFGESFAAYSASMASVDANVVTTTTNAADSIVKLAKSLPENKLFTNETTLSEFGQQLSLFGSYFAAYYGHISNVNVYTLSSVVDEMWSLIDMVKGLKGLDTSVLSSFGNNLKKLGNAGIDEFINAFTNSTSRIQNAANAMITSFINAANAKIGDLTTTFSKLMNEVILSINAKNVDFNKAGENTLTYFIAGITKKNSNVLTTFQQIMSKALTEIRSKYNSFKSAGAYIVEGLAKGIQENQSKAVAQARAMAKAVEDATKGALGIHSPSTVFYAVAGYSIQGFVNGIQDGTPKVENSGEQLGTSLIESVRDTLKIDESSSELAKKTIGETFVNGIAEGITEDMSAEEAAAKKAENIATAFQNAMEKIDLSSETSSLEQSLWEGMNENTYGESVKNAVKLEGLTKEYEYQTQRVELAKAEYQATVEEFGETSQKAQEAYNEILQQQITLADLANQITDLKEEEVTRQQELNDKKTDLLEQEYSIWKNQNESIIDEAESALADLALLTEQYEAQVAATNRAQSKYFETMNAFGKGSSEAIEAYSTYMDAYESLSELSNELMEAQKAQLEYDAEAFNTYKVYLAANQRRLLEEGYSAAEIHQKALSESGYDLDAMVSRMQEEVHSAVVNSMSTVQTAYAETADKTFGSLISNFTEYGESYATALGEGIQNGSNEVAKSASDMVQSATGTTSLGQDTFAQLGASAVTSFVTGIQSNLELITEGSNLMAQTLMDGLTNALSGGVQTDDAVSEIDESQPQFSLAGQGLMTKLSEGIALMLEPVTNTVLNLINNALLQFQNNYLNFNLTGQEVMTNFIAGVRSKEELTLAAFRVIVVHALTTIRGYHSNFVSVGEYLAQGLAQGIRNGESTVINAAIAVAVAAIKAAKAKLGVKSPSKEFEEIGMYADLGFARGLREYAGEAADASSEMGQTALNSLSSTIGRISNALNGEMDMQPTIRPVLDLSNVEAGASQLNTMFSRNQAMSISTGMNQNGVEETQTGAITPNQGNSFQFVQNNYSPKALSRVEIYRQTNNQFSKFERMVKT